ncbi:MAG: DUF86 domain-containing protein [Aestuariivita sp.]|nr:DUF86 domain-containing protein [Aestuariivita sp.]MCY4203497.1 DUF86 domain-containing protein [Aestuariivita sp.]MCY4288080.1 DUF86 domain-containing protein [Aestuariivita sp.]MCY4346352.1 DUF86 domain-containing protein [Aestuariivita sp.]
MSDRQDDTTTRDWKRLFRDMIGFADKVMKNTSGLDQASFVENDLVYDATIRNLHLIGESASKVPENVRHQAADVAWRKIIGMRNRLVHDYLGIDDDILWNVIKNEVPVLRDALRLFLESHGQV